MKIPARGIAGWAAEIIRQCSSSRSDRIQRGAFYRNLYLTGDENAEPAVYNKSFDYIEDTSAFLFSPVELRFTVAPNGPASPEDRAKSHVVGAELMNRFRAANVDTMSGETNKWSLVKGNCFLMLLWTVKGFQPQIVQPEMMGVLREDHNGLDNQEAFVHSTYLTPTAFQEMLSGRPQAEQTQIMRRVRGHFLATKGADAPDQAAILKQVIVGGFQPYQGVGGVGNSQQQKGSAYTTWLAGPYPNFDAKVTTTLIRLDTLWVRNDMAQDDDGRKDWATFQIVGDDIVLFGDQVLRNAFADFLDNDDGRRIKPPDENNPLFGHHPYIEFCPNRLDGYFWGRSELNNTALLQRLLNNRVNGINRLLRLQEDPPKYYRGGTNVTATKHSKLNKPGGFLYDSEQNAKEIQNLAPELPTGLYESIQEIERMFHEMGGYTETLLGHGASGVRSQAQAQTLTRNASPRFKDKALRVERTIEELGGLGLDILRAKEPAPLYAWLMPSEPSASKVVPLDERLALEPPAKGMDPVKFTFHDLGEVTVRVDSHSGSPAFGQDSAQKAIALAHLGAIAPADLIKQLHPADEDALVAAAEQRVIEQAQFQAEHPELLEKQAKRVRR